MAIGLISGAAWCHAIWSSRVCRGRLGDGGLIGQQGKLIGGDGLGIRTLLGFEDEAGLAVKVGPAASKLAGTGEGDGAFKAVVIALAISAFGFGWLRPQKAGQCGCKGRKVSHFAAA